MQAKTPRRSLTSARGLLPAGGPGGRFPDGTASADRGSVKKGDAVGAGEGCLFPVPQQTGGNARPRPGVCQLTAPVTPRRRAAR
jgi:hypothetical protein